MGVDFVVSNFALGSGKVEWFVRSLSGSQFCRQLRWRFRLRRDRAWDVRARTGPLFMPLALSPGIGFFVIRL